jgi:hydrogenase maturation protease
MGLGNILLQDEGMGVRTLEQLIARYRLPEEVQAIDGGTKGLDLLPYLEGVTHLLIIDAVQDSLPPGTLVRLEGGAIPSALLLKASMHQVGLHELLAVSALRGTLPPHIVVWGMQPASLEWGDELTPPVAAQVEELLQAVVHELCDWGVAVKASTVV